MACPLFLKRSETTEITMAIKCQQQLFKMCVILKLLLTAQQVLSVRWSDDLIFFSERIVIYLTWNHKWEKNCDAIYHNNTTIVHVHSTRYHLCFGGSRDQTIMPRAHLHNLVQTQFLPTMTTVSWSIERSAVPDILGNPV